MFGFEGCLDFEFLQFFKWIWDFEDDFQFVEQGFQRSDFDINGGVGILGFQVFNIVGNIGRSNSVYLVNLR